MARPPITYARLREELESEQSVLQEILDQIEGKNGTVPPEELSGYEDLYKSAPGAASDVRRARVTC